MRLLSLYSSLIILSFVLFATVLSKEKVKMIPKVKFIDGNEIPAIGLGTSQSLNEEGLQAVKDAIDIGYRHIDTARIYGNEKEVGAALKAKFDEGVIKREDIFITDKLWNTDHAPELVEKALRSTLADLGLDYVDLYLIHWPMSFKLQNGKQEFNNVDYVDTWKAMEKVAEKGLAKSIGLSNFNKRQIKRVLEVATMRPVNLQIECHPYLNQKKLIDFCRSENITVTAYSPLGSPGRTTSQSKSMNLLKDAKLKAIGDKYKKTPAQVVLRYQVQRDVIPIPKSVTKSRLEENFNIFDFELSSDDMAYIDTFNTNDRVISSFGRGHPEHPFDNDEY